MDSDHGRSRSKIGKNMNWNRRAALRVTAGLVVARWSDHLVLGSDSGTESPVESVTPKLAPVVLQMLRNEAIFSELRLTASEQAAVVEIMDRVDGPWWRSRLLEATQQQNLIHQITMEVKSDLARALSVPQLTRLAQLERQALGTRMFALAEVRDALAISPVISKRLIDGMVATDAKVEELQKGAQAGEPAGKLEEEQKRLADRERELVSSQLTAIQRQKLAALVGTPFDFSQVTRTHPRAPELFAPESAWIQIPPGNGAPPAIDTSADGVLGSLRGQVVAVHFYAFQCINCVRNLPHYSAWHRDLASKGLVVIGIQTPETSKEREPARVAAAAKEQSIEYPLLMDGDSINWKNWGTTMWPTVYLVDKEGYLRSWWQGEMNWKGTPGEQKMRGYIERLLAE